jgi:hypothetical protein
MERSVVRSLWQRLRNEAANWRKPPRWIGRLCALLIECIRVRPTQSGTILGRALNGAIRQLLEESDGRPPLLARFAVADAGAAFTPVSTFEPRELLVRAIRARP